MSSISEERRKMEATLLEKMAKELNDVANARDDDVGRIARTFADQATMYSVRIRDAETLDAATALCAEVDEKREEWQFFLNESETAASSQPKSDQPPNPARPPLNQKALEIVAEQLNKLAEQNRSNDSGERFRTMADACSMYSVRLRDASPAETAVLNAEIEGKRNEWLAALDDAIHEKKGIFTEDDRETEVELLKILAQQLTQAISTKAGKHYEDALRGFADQASMYACRLRDAPTLEAADVLREEIVKKRTRWAELLNMLHLADNMDGKDQGKFQQQAANEAEEQLRHLAKQLRSVAGRQDTSVFRAIGKIADEAEQKLEEFLKAPTDEEKLAIWEQVEAAREDWLSNMSRMHTNLSDGAETEATDANDPNDPALDYADDACGEFKDKKTIEAIMTTMRSGCTLGGGNGYADFSSFGGSGFEWNFQPVTGAASSSAAPDVELPGGKAPQEPVAPREPVAAPPTEGVGLSQTEAREQLVTYLSDKEEGLLVTLRKAVEKVKADDRFAEVVNDSEEMLKQMELAAGAVIPDALTPVQTEFEDSVKGAEDKLQATVEPMRKAQWGGFYAKKAATQVCKYDLYKAKGGQPKLKDHHPELLECAQVCKELGEYLRKEAQNQIMDGVVGLVGQAMSETRARGGQSNLVAEMEQMMASHQDLTARSRRGQNSNNDAPSSSTD